jgi:hypothetical protein
MTTSLSDICHDTAATYPSASGQKPHLSAADCSPVLNRSGGQTALGFHENAPEVLAAALVDPGQVVENARAGTAEFDGSNVRGGG